MSMLITVYQGRTCGEGVLTIVMTSLCTDDWLRSERCGVLELLLRHT
jgi:hypothetical protein